MTTITEKLNKTPFMELQEKFNTLKLKSNKKIETLKEKVVKQNQSITLKNDKLRAFREGKTYKELQTLIDETKAQNTQLRRDIVKRQTIGCLECKQDKRLVRFTNLSICLECIKKFEDLKWKGY